MYTEEIAGKPADRRQCLSRMRISSGCHGRWNPDLHWSVLRENLQRLLDSAPEWNSSTTEKIDMVRIRRDAATQGIRSCRSLLLIKKSCRLTARRNEVKKFMRYTEWQLCLIEKSRCTTSSTSFPRWQKTRASQRFFIDDAMRYHKEICRRKCSGTEPRWN
jgi:hypothetical protein